MTSRSVQIHSAMVGQQSRSTITPSAPSVTAPLGVVAESLAALAKTGLASTGHGEEQQRFAEILRLASELNSNPAREVVAA